MKWPLTICLMLQWSLLTLAPLPALAQAPRAPDFTAIDGTITAAIAAHKIPGAVVVVGHDGEVVLRRAYGQRSLEPTQEPMSTGTIFDMASLTKALATAPSIMLLAEQGRLQIDDPVAKYLPEFGTEGKPRVTIRELLTHYSGLAPDLDLTTPWAGRDEAMRRAYSAKLQSAPAGEFRYSDINYIVLGALVERITGQSLADFAKQYIFRSLGMTRTRFLPPADWIQNIAPTEYDESGHMLRGVVHDPTARRMGGIAGHAGLFSTADDVALFAQGLLDQLRGTTSAFPLSRATLLLATTPQQPAGGSAIRGLGWDIASPYSRNRGEVFAAGSFGHSGFTGTSLWMDPASDTYVIFLSNRVHPRGGINITGLEGEVATEAARAVGVQATIAKLSTGDAGSVLTGIDVLEANHFQALARLAARHNGPLKLGLLTNQTGVDHQGRRTIDVLAHEAAAAVPGLTLTTLFSPEHGLSGIADTEQIASGIDASTRLPIVSLYGAKDADRRPRVQDLRKLDAVVIDIQDAGARFYTYETIVGYFLEAAAKVGLDVIILDRPNPIGGTAVEGPMSDVGRESYTNYMPVPVRHGLTLGEYARYANGERYLGARLTIVPMHSWRRDEWFDATGIPWINPSPNLRSLTASILYPGIGMIETTNISVGRGTSEPFEQVGAPWIEGERLAARLNGRNIPGVQFVAIRFTPTTPYPYAGEHCGGVRILLKDRAKLDSPELGLEIAVALHSLYPTEFHLERIDRLMVNRQALDALSEGADPRVVTTSGDVARTQFIARRRHYLLY